MTKKIEMTKTEAAKAGKIGTEKYEELCTLMNRFPTFEIEIVKTSTKSVDHLKGLTYEYMEMYIQKHDDAEKSIMAEYLMLRGKTGEAEEALAESFTYLEMKDWFLKKFPAIASFHEARAKLLAA